MFEWNLIFFNIYSKTPSIVNLSVQFDFACFTKETKSLPNVLGTLKKKITLIRNKSRKYKK